MKGYFQYYETFEKIVQKFKTEEARNIFRAKIVFYGLFGIEPELNELEDMVWDIIKEMIDDQVHKRQVNAENRKTKNVPAEKNENVETVDSILNEDEPQTESNVQETEQKTTVKNRFKKPTVAEIEEYCNERKNGLSAQRFFDYYESKGWLVGKSPMKDWKASVRTWEQKTNTPAGIQQNQVSTLPEDRLIL